VRGGANRLGIIHGGHNRLSSGASPDQNADCGAVGLGRDEDIGRSINHGGGVALCRDMKLGK
jgi:hypothetical protein